MNRKKQMIRVSLFVILSFLLSQCVLPQGFNTDSYSPPTLFLHPNTRFAVVGDPIQLEGFGISRSSGNRLTFTFTVNGSEHARRFYNDVGSGVSLSPTADWVPRSPGEYYLQLTQSQTRTFLVSDAIRVCVLDFSLAMSDVSDPDFIGPHGYEQDCEVPERSAAAHSGDLTFSAHAVPSSMKYYPGLWSPIREQWVSGAVPPEECSDLGTTLTFNASLDDPNDDVVFVKVDLSYETVSGNREETLVLNKWPDISLPNKEFSGSTTTRYISNSYRQPPTVNNVFDITWTASALGRSGDNLAMDGPHTISVEPCVYYEPVFRLDAPNPTATPFTPSELTCPPGTYYAPATNRCIEVQIPQEKSGNGGGNGGSCTLTQAECTNQGLSFNKPACKCEPIQ